MYIQSNFSNYHEQLAKRTGVKSGKSGDNTSGALGDITNSTINSISQTQGDSTANGSSEEGPSDDED